MVSAGAGVVLVGGVFDAGLTERQLLAVFTGFSPSHAGNPTAFVLVLQCAVTIDMNSTMPRAFNAPDGSAQPDKASNTWQ